MGGLQGYEMPEGDTLAIGIPESSCVWQFIPQAGSDRFVLRNVADSVFLYAKFPAATGLAVHEKEKTEWQISESDGFFALNNTDSPNRYLGFYTGSIPKFGHYTEYEIIHLNIYKMVRLLPDKKGTGTLPDNGALVTLHANGFLRTKEGTALPSEGYITNAGEVAPDGNWQKWELSILSDSATFVLRNENGAFLGYDLECSPEQIIWRFSNGHIVTDETPQRYLCFNGTFSVQTAEQTEGASDVSLLPLGNEAGSTTQGTVKKLTGAWSAHRLSQLSWNGTSAVDASNIRLPKMLQPFLHRPAYENTIIYINAQDSTLIPQEWAFVVACEEDEENNLLIRQTAVHDRKQLKVDRNITCQSGQMTYKREIPADGCWMTLCIPFNATVPEAFKAEIFVGMEQNILIFKPVDKITAGEPVIIRSLDANATSLFLKSNTSSLIPSDTEEKDACMKGTYSDIKISDDTDHIYFLNETGDSFARAAGGSSLAPFRAYLKLSSMSTHYMIRHWAETTGIDNADNEGLKQPQHCFRLNGTLAGTASTSSETHQLPAGIYIINGKKILIK